MPRLNGDITRARIVWGDDDYPTLHLTIGGIRAVLGVDHHPDLLAAGLVFLGADWEDLLDPVTVPADKRIGRPKQVLTGYTDDPRVVELYRRFLASDLLEDGDLEA